MISKKYNSITGISITVPIEMHATTTLSGFYREP